MKKQQIRRRAVTGRFSRATIAMAAGLLTVGCAAAAPSTPEPRPIIIYSGARLRPDHERMSAVNKWVTEEQQNIVQDPSFFIGLNQGTEEVYPWDGIEILEDTVNVPFDMTAPDTRVVQELYGHMHLMVVMGRQAEWVPEAPDATGYELERAILSRTADAWLLGRTSFDLSPYGPLDELTYSKEAGFLDAFVFTARPDEFASERADWARANPAEIDRYRSWFLETFNREPPGLRTR